MFDPASPQATAISDLFLSVWIACAVVFVVVVAIITYAIVRAARERARGIEVRDAEEHELGWLEVVWTAIPLLIVAGIFVFSVRAANESDPSPQGPPDVIMRGHQWWWEVEYPEHGVVTANELHVPVGVTVQVQVESADVIHNFWLPALSRKIDAIPGRINHVSFRPERTGRFEGICAEFCGDQHAWMRFDTFVHEKGDYEAWLAAQALPARPPSSPVAEAGRKIYLRETCNRCHVLRGLPTEGAPVQIGPDLTHLASRRMLGAGVLTNGREHLQAWLKNPQAIKEGCHMPNFQFSDEEAAELASYLSSLR